MRRKTLHFTLYRWRIIGFNKLPNPTLNKPAEVFMTKKVALITGITGQDN